MSINQNYIFVSYARIDGVEFASRLHDDLEGLGFTVWLDKHDIQGDWEIEITQGLRAAQAVLVVVTPGIISSVPVRAEYNDALNRNIPVIPLLIQDTDMPPILAVFQWIDFRPGYQAALTLLADRLSGLHEHHLDYLRQQLSAVEIAQQNASTPQRWEGKIQSLRTTIANWDGRFEVQDERILEGLEQQRQELIAASERRRETARQHVVGQRLSDMTHHFQDRVYQQREISRLLAEPSTRIVSVIGRGGMGKTALVSKILGDVENGVWPHTDEEIPVNGIVYLSTRTAGISLERLFLDCAEMLGGEQQKELEAIWTKLHLDIEAKITRLFEALRDGLYLILLDNMEDILSDDGQVQDEDLRTFFEMGLVTPHAARLLVTSRIPLSLKREVMRFNNTVPLTDGLPAVNGIEMLRELDPSGEYGLRDATDEELTRVVELTHGVPRALEVIAGILANDPFADLSEILTGFYGHEEVAQVLVQEAYKRLDSDARHVMEALAVFGCPVKVVAVDYLLQPFFPGIDVPRVARRLQETAMISIDRAHKTMSLHPIDRDCAYSQLPEEGLYTRKALERRAASYYAEIRTPSDTWLSIDDLQPQLAEFEHLIKAEDYDEAARLLALFNDDYLYVWGYLQRVLTMSQSLMGKLTDPHLVVLNLYDIGYIYNDFGEYDKGMPILQKGLRAAQELGDHELEYTGLNCLSYGYFQLGNVDEGIRYGQQIQELGNRHNNRRYHSGATLFLVLSQSEIDG